MSAITSPRRKSLIAGAAILAVAAGAYGVGRLYPPVGPSSGAIAAAQDYVETIAGEEIPARGRYVLVDAASARLFMIEDGHVRDAMKVVVGTFQ
jgi:L,D-transpeptidase YcbB